MSWKNQLYFGDNLEVLRDSIPAKSVDLIYLDPPFNSKANYNILFKSPKGIESSAQITAFEDTWHWSGGEAEKEFGELIHQSNTDVSEMIQALRRFLGENDMMAYLVMMANRLIELHRVLKDTGSLYLHCDVTASHYLKIVLDSIFGKEHFQNEITWKRTTAHSDSSRYGANTDIIFFYTKSAKYTFNPAYQPYTEEYKARFSHKDPDGRVWTDDNLTAKGLSGGGYEYEYKGFTSLWRCPLETMERLDKENKLYFTKTGGIRFKRYLDELPGIPSQALWDDIFPINSQSKERLGYPTQKPLQLLERIISVSSNENDIVLDPFCGCGTAVHAAEKLKRRWMGIDVTHLAISLVEKRLKDAFPGIEFEVHGTPKDLDSAQNLAERDKYQFQWWACSLVNAQPYQGKKKGADSGIDGIIYFQDEHQGLPKKIVVSVKGGTNINVAMIRDLGHVIDREKASIGIFITMVEPTRPMREEAVKAGYFETRGSNFPKIQILTIKGLLEGTEQAKYPDLMQGGLTFKKATIDNKTSQDTLF